LEKALYLWFKDMRQKGGPINGLVLKTKATHFGKILVSQDFEASSGFISRFIKRHGIKLQTKCGESESVCEETVNEWKAKVKQIIANYEPKNIFNIDETAVLWRLMQSKTYALPEESTKGYKKSKDRVTAALIVNTDGSERYLAIIGKSRSPRCFKGIKNFPIFKYYNNSTSWMTSNIFTEMIQILDKKFRLNNRKVIMILDNCSSHPNLKLTNIELLFLPPNTTAKLQPLDAGLIRSFKQRYRNQLLNYIIECLESENDCKKVLKKFNLLKAIHFMDSSIKSIPNSVFVNCFRSCGIDFGSDVETIASEEPMITSEEWN
jgi:hypothetical protein